MSSLATKKILPIHYILFCNRTRCYLASVCQIFMSTPISIWISCILCHIYRTLDQMRYPERLATGDHQASPRLYRMVTPRIELGFHNTPLLVNPENSPSFNSARPSLSHQDSIAELMINDTIHKRVCECHCRANAHSVHSADCAFASF